MAITAEGYLIPHRCGEGDVYSGSVPGMKATQERACDDVLVCKGGTSQHISMASVTI